MKSSKKALALALAAAMAITGIPVTDAGAATTAKLSATKATIYVGGSKTVSVSTPKSWKNVKVTVSSTRKSVATAKKTSAKKFKVTAVKAGTAKVKVKVTYKKSAKKGAKTYTKNLSFKATVKTPSITLNQSSVTLNVGETAPVKVTKKTPSSLVVKYTSEDPAIASVAKGTITAISAGTTNIVVSSTYGTKTITKKVKVNVSAAKDGLTPALTNQLNATDYPETVLVSDPAIINVTYARDGKPVAGQTLVASVDKIIPNSGSTTANCNYQFETVTAKTNSSGVATFVLKNKGNRVKMSSTNEVASVNYKIQLADEATETGTNAITGTVNFAAISVADVWNLNNVDKDIKNIEPGTNYVEVHKDQEYARKDGLWWRIYKTNVDEITDTTTEYVASQQVSSKGTDEHKVVMEGGYPYIVLPGKENDAKTTKGSQEINYTSGPYKTYADEPKVFQLEKDPKKLSYATLNFKDVSISKYTALVVECFDSEAALKANAPFDKYQYDGEMTQAGFGYPIPLKKAQGNGIWIRVTLKSKGQVQDGKNTGYTATNIDYVYKNPETTVESYKFYKGGKVTWKQVDTPYTAETAVTTGSAILNRVQLPDSGTGYNTDGFNFGKYNYTVKLPVFPYTGNAIITKKDQNGKVQAYFSVETHNNGENKNEIVEGRTAYQISADEVRETTGTIEQTDTTLTLNAENAGRMTLEGVVTIDGKELDEADLAHVYTSVQWNPIPKTTASNSKKYVALLGQKIDVVAQLVDKNGNAVSESGKSITFFAGDKPLTPDETLTKDNGAVYGKATVVDVKPYEASHATTDSQGQAKVSLKASEITTVTDVTAKADDKRYDVELIIKDEKVESADLYWADADLVFEDKVDTEKTKGAKVKTDTTNISVKTDSNAAIEIKPTAGTSWLYGVYTDGTYYDIAKATTSAIKIKGIDVAISKTAESVGTFENLGEGVAKATSTKAGGMDLVTKINASTGTTKATVETTGFTFAGTGAPSIDKKLEVNVHWQTDGITASYIIPTGTRVTTNDSINVYVKVQDKLGNAITNQDVTFSVDTNASIAGAVGGKRTVKTDSTYGIATVSMSAIGATAGSTTTVRAKVNDDSFDQTFTWVAKGADLDISKATNADGDYVTRYDKEKKTITLVFNDDIVADSVIKEQFTVTYGGITGASVKLLAVKDVVVNDNTVTLTFADVPELAEANSPIFVGINTATTKANGHQVQYTLTSKNGATFKAKTVRVYAANDNDPGIYSPAP